jgi:Cu-processing system permease protein
VSVIAMHAIRESLRRRAFAVVLVLSIVFLVLYAWGASELFEDVDGFSDNAFDVDAETLAGGTILGLAMFAILFLGAVLATFLTLAGCCSRSSSGRWAAPPTSPGACSPPAR